MSYLFDSSSILNLTRELGAKVVAVMKGNMTTSLAYYELGNTIWKECVLAKWVTVNEAVETLKFAFSLLDLMKIIHIKDVDLSVKVLSNASKLKITYYDAAYLTVAQEFDKVLVSDDEKLIGASHKIRVKASLSKIFVEKR